MGCWAAAVMVPDLSQNVLVCKAGHNLPDDWAALTNPIDKTTLNGRTYVGGEIIVQNGLNQTTVRNAPTVHRIYGIMVVPIRKDSNVIATLEFINDEQSLVFDEAEIRLAQNAAVQISKLLAA
jgi:GAF domain-containing protein